MRQSRRVDPGLDRPVYKQVADDLREQIERGDLPPGRLLPGESRLCTIYGVGMNSVRAALALLRTERLIVTEKGVGSRVRDPQEPAVVNVPLGEPFRTELRDPTAEERTRWRLERGTLVIDIEQGDQTLTVPALPGTVIQAGNDRRDAESQEQEAD